MNVFTGIKNIFSPPTPTKSMDFGEVIAKEQNYGDLVFGAMGSSAPVYSFAFDGSDELTINKPIIEYTPDHLALAQRSWQAYYESEIVQMVLGNDIRWTIGSGLTYRAEPSIHLLEKMGISMEADQFAATAEEYFKVLKKSRLSVYSKTQNLDQYFAAGRLVKQVSGDALYVYRFRDGVYNVQIIDGMNVWSERREFEGREIRHGVELNPDGSHEAYWIRVKGQFASQRLAVYSDTGRQLVYMGYASKYRIDDVRGMPFLSACLATADAITEYRRTTLASAQERENIAYFAEHGKASEGEDVLKPGLKQRAQALAIQGVPPETGAERLAVSPSTAGKIKATTKKQFINMPIDTTLKVVESKNNLYFKEFFRENLGVVCAAAGGQPPEMVLNKFEGSFSSSRMGGEVWDHNKNILIEDEITVSYKPFVDLNNEALVRTGRISAPGYREAIDRDPITKEAANKNRFLGKPVPHVDPVKEAKAEREKLGDAFDNVPLTTPTDSAERLGCGDYTANIAKAYDDMDAAAAVLGLMDSNGEVIDG